MDPVDAVMNGFEVLETVRDDPPDRQIPFIVLTAELSAEAALVLGPAISSPSRSRCRMIILGPVARIIELSEGRQLIVAAENDVLTGLYTRTSSLSTPCDCTASRGLQMDAS
jgi:CheY-like chemotaxis protein